MRNYRNNQQILAQAKRLINSNAIDNPRIREQVIASLAGALNRHMSKAPTTGKGWKIHIDLCALYQAVKESGQ